jgi:hypothetical protein
VLATLGSNPGTRRPRFPSNDAGTRQQGFHGEDAAARGPEFRGGDAGMRRQGFRRGDTGEPWPRFRGDDTGGQRPGFRGGDRGERWPGFHGRVSGEGGPRFSVSGGRIGLVVTWLLMLPIGLYGLAQIANTTLRQFGGPAEMVDLVAFYTGGRLLLEAPSQLYDPVAELQLQTRLRTSAPQAHAVAALPVQDADATFLQSNPTLLATDATAPPATGTPAQADMTIPKSDVTTAEAEVTTPAADVTAREAEVTTAAADVTTSAAHAAGSEARVTGPEAGVTATEADGLPLLQFWNPPHVAVLMAPLALLPFGLAYLALLLVNLACLGGGCYLLVGGGDASRPAEVGPSDAMSEPVPLVAPAPRAQPGPPAPLRSARSWTWLCWALVLPLFLPVQVGLMMGQLSFGLLFGFAVFTRVIDRGGPFRTAAALAVWSTKPQLLPVLLVALACKREWRALALLCGLPLLLTVPVVLLGGWSVLENYVALGGIAAGGVLSAETTTLYAGHSLLGLAQWLLGAGWPANILAVFGTLGVCLLVGRTWRGGLRVDARRHLQLAMVPLAAIVCSPHALAYDDVIWLASAWLLLRFARATPSASRIVTIVLLVGWWGGNLAALPGVYGLAPWGAFTAIFCLASIAWLYRLYGLGATQSSAWGGRANAAASSATSV